MGAIVEHGSVVAIMQVLNGKKKKQGAGVVSCCGVVLLLCGVTSADFLFFGNGIYRFVCLLCMCRG